MKLLEENKFILESVQKVLFYLLVFSLAFLQPYQIILRQRIPFTDIVFFILALFSLGLLVLRLIEFRWHRFNWFLLSYLFITGISIFASDNLPGSFIKYLSEFYLTGLVFLGFNIVKDQVTMRLVVQIWLFATFLACLVGIVSIVLYYMQPDSWLLVHTQFHYGAVPVGNYPRINSTFLSASLFCNYLSVSLVFLLIARKCNWIGPFAFPVIISLILINSIFTISSGLGAIALILGVWFWFLYQETYRLTSRFALGFGIFIPVLFLLLNFVALQKYPTAPFKVTIPFINSAIYPSPRYLVWSECFRTFLDKPILGVGIGQTCSEVLFQNSEGTNSLLTDAHSTYLSIASQTGVLGFIVLLVGIYLMLAEIFPVGNARTDISSIRFGLGLAFVSAFIYQGFLGSFEDTRHLWVLIGLVLSASGFRQKDSLTEDKQQLH
jgi:O-antigen ligase